MANTELAQQALLLSRKMATDLGSVVSAANAEIASLLGQITDASGPADPLPPTPTPVPLPTPVPVTPTPTPVPPDPADPASYVVPPEAKILSAGTDLSKLSAGNYVLEGGDFTRPNAMLRGVNLFAATPRQSFLKGGGGQLILNGGGLRGMMGVGGGLNAKLNDKAALILGDNAVFINGGWQNAQGVAIAGDGSRIQVIGAWLFDNGSAGVGGKIDDGLIANCWCKGNNVKVGDSDGAVMGKFTRSNRITIKNNKVEGGPNAAIWFDISNGPGEIVGNTIRDIRLLRSNEPWTAVGIKLEINFPGWKVYQNDIAGTGSYCVDVGETFDVEIYENLLEESPPSKDGGVLGLRNQTRSDTPSSPANAWKLGKIDFHHNTLTKGFGTITGSGSGDKNMKLSKYGITVHDNVGTVKYQNISPA